MIVPSTTCIIMMREETMLPYGSRDTRVCPPSPPLSSLLSFSSLSDCPPPVPVLAIVLGVIAGIVILGILLLLLWKLLTILHDRAEYAKFANERLMAKWDTVSYYY